MGKILKYCNTCDEGFAERFTFCPVCSAELHKVEMNPVVDAPTEQAHAAEPEAPAFIADNKPSADEVALASAPTVEIPAAEVTEAPPIMESTRPVEANGNGNSYHHTEAFRTPKGILFDSEPRYADEVRHTLPPPILSKGDDGYSITVIEEKNVSQRNYLLLGATTFMLSMAFLAWGVSLFQKALDVGAIGDERSLALLLDDVPMPVEDEPQPKAKDKDAGGGGGGGREEKEETTLGDLANQTKDPIRPPDAKVPRLDNPELLLPPPSTEGNKKFESKYDNYGDPNGKFKNLSNGPGSGGGIGTGQGTGQGSGTGTGAGSGTGSGYGSGFGNGNGSGSGDGDSGRNVPPPAGGISQPLKITAKQKAQYTDAARQNNVQGTVTLRVTFLASGSIGSIATIKGLPYGLTEQAIAAARAMRFEPEKVNGVPRTTTRPVSFTFNIY